MMKPSLRDSPYRHPTSSRRVKNCLDTPKGDPREIGLGVQLEILQSRLFLGAISCYCCLPAADIVDAALCTSLTVANPVRDFPQLYCPFAARPSNSSFEPVSCRSGGPWAKVTSRRGSEGSDRTT